MLNVQNKHLKFHEIIKSWPRIGCDQTRFELRSAQAQRMKKILLQFVTVATPELKKSRVFDGVLRKLWRDLMADCQFVLDPNLVERNVCNLECFKHHTMLRLSNEHHLYGCWLHGYVHKCDRNSQSCRSVFTAQDLEDICIFSGRSLGVTDIVYADSTYKEGFGSDGFDRHKYALSREDMDTKRNSFRMLPEAPPAKSKEELAHEHAARVYAELIKEKENEAPNSKIAALVAHAVKKPEAKRLKPQQPVAAHEMSEVEARVDAAVQMAKEISEKRGVDAPKVSDQRVDQMRRKSEAKVHATISTVFHDFLDSDSRKLYNEYCERAHRYALRRTIDEHLKNAQRDRVLPNTSKMLTKIANVNQNLEEILVEIDQPTQIIGRYTSLITMLWKICFASPYARAQIDLASNSPAQERRQKRNDSRRASRGGAGNFTPTPINTGLCTLRQFTLAILYSLRTGFCVKIKNSLVSDSGKTVIAPDTKLSSMLPPRAKVHYFGEVARRALRCRLANSYFGPSQFDPLENIAQASETMDSHASHSDTITMLMRHSKRGSTTERTIDDTHSDYQSMFIKNKRTDDASVRSASSIRSKSIAASLTHSQQSAIRKKSRKRRRAADDIPLVEGEAETRNSVLSSTGGSSASEAMCVAVNKREPFLNGHDLAYSEHAIEEGLRMLKMSLESYGSELQTLLVASK